MSRRWMSRTRSGPPPLPASDRTAEDGSTAGDQPNPDSIAKPAGTIALIDSKALTREATLGMLGAALPRYHVIAAATCDELLAVQGSSHRLRLVILNVRCAGLAHSAIRESLQELKERLPDAPVIALSDRDDAEGVVDALALGLRGYIPTSTDPDVAFAAVRLVDAGGTFIPADALSPAAPRPESGAEAASAEAENAVAHNLDLTPRELSVLDLLREGKPNKQIAVQLRMQESTVKVHVRSIMKKLKAANRTQAAFLADRRLSGRGPEPATRTPPVGRAIASRDRVPPEDR